MKVLSVASILALAIATQSAVTNAAPALHTVTQYVEPVTVTVYQKASGGSYHHRPHRPGRPGRPHPPVYGSSPKPSAEPSESAESLEESAESLEESDDTTQTDEYMTEAPTAPAESSSEIKSSASPDTPYQTSPTSEDTSDETSPASEDTPDEASSAAEPEESGSADASDWVTKMICAINSVRSKEGLQPLGISSQLNSIADKHSEYQNSIGQMTHDDPAGGVGERLSALGVNWSNAAENVAAGMTTPEEAQRALEASPAHLANMVDPGMNFVGAGRANNYYTQNFYGDGSAAAAVNVPQC